MSRSSKTSTLLRAWLKRLLQSRAFAPAQSRPELTPNHYIDLFVTPLEPRRVLNADFTLIGGVLDLTAFEAAEVIVQDSANGEDFEFILNSGTWENDAPAGVDVDEQTLTVDKTLVTDTIRIDDSAAGSDLNVTFHDVSVSTLDKLAVAEVGTISVNGALTVQGTLIDLNAKGAVTVGGSIAVTDDVADNGSIALTSQQNIFVDGGTISSVDGSIMLRGNVAVTDNGDGTFSFDRGTSTANAIGVQLLDAQVSTSGSGDVQVLGGGAGPSWAWHRDGVRIEGSAITTAQNDAGGGDIEIWGISAGAAGGANGIDIRDNATDEVSLVSAASGHIRLTGTSFGTDFSAGVLVTGGSDVEWTGSTTEVGADVVTLSIIGESNAIGRASKGVEIVGGGTTITSSYGDIFISGLGATGATTNATGDSNNDPRWNHGVEVLNGAVVESTGVGANAANVAITGTGRTGVRSIVGVSLWNGSITTIDGDVAIDGTSGTTTGGSNQGVQIGNNGFVEATGTGNIDITGVSRGEGGTNNDGVRVNSGSNVDSHDGSIQITGTGGQGISDSAGVRLFGQVIADGSGTVGLNGTGGTAIPGPSLTTTYGHSNPGVYIDAGAQTFGSTFETSNASVMSRTGNISIVGTAGDWLNTLGGSSFGIHTVRQAGIYSVSGHIALDGSKGTGADGIEFDGGRIYSTDSAGTSWISDSRIRLQPGSTIDLASGSILLRSPEEIDLFGSVAGGAAEIDSAGSRLHFGGSVSSSAVDISDTDISKFHSVFGFTPLTIGRDSEVYIDATPRVSDDFAFADGATVTFVADNSGATPNGQLQLGGSSPRTVNLNDARLNLLPYFYSDVLSNELVLIDVEHAGSTVNGTFDGLAEGATFEAGAHLWQITYVGGVDSNDVVVTAIGELTTPSETRVSLDSNGNLVIEDITTVSNDDLTITVDGDQIVITDATHTVSFDATIEGAIRWQPNEVRVLREEVTGDQIIVNTGAGDDLLVTGKTAYFEPILNANGDVLTIVYNAGDGSDDDTLEVKSERTDRAYQYGDPGTVEITVISSDTPRYHVNANGIERVIDLDPVFSTSMTFSDGDDDISYTNPEAGVVRISSSAIPTTDVFQSFFLDDLIIDLGDGNDTLNLEHVGAPDDFLRIIGGEGDDTVTFASMSLGDRLEVDVDSIIFDGTVSMSTGFSIFGNDFGVTLNATDSITGTGGLLRARGDFTMTAGGNIGSDDDLLEISGAVTASSTGGNIYLASQSSIVGLLLEAPVGEVVVESGGSIFGGAADIDVRALQASLTAEGIGSTDSPLQLEVGALQTKFSATGSDQFLDVQGTLTDIDINAGQGDIALTTTGGIGDSDAVFGAGTDIIGRNLTLQINDDAGSFGSASDPITTELLALEILKTFDAFVEETDSLKIESATSALGGALSFASTNINIVGAIDTPGGSITLRNSATDSLTQVGGKGEVDFPELIGDAAAYYFTVAANEQSENVGYEVASAGDINGDGIADLLITAPFRDVPNLTSGSYLRGGRVFVVFGGAANLEALDTVDGAVDGVVDLERLGDVATAGGFEIRGGTEDARLGISATSVGDFNGDGKDDLLIGMQGSPHAVPAVPGGGFLMFGDHSSGDLNLATLDGTIDASNPLDADRRGIAIHNTAAPEQFGTYVAAGDINGDGFDDLAIAAYYGNRADVLFGFADPSVSSAIEAADLLDGVDDGTLNVSTITQSAGYTIETPRIIKSLAIGDISGDIDVATGRNQADLILGSEELDSSTVTGMTYVLFGEDLASIDAADGTADSRIEATNASLRLQNMPGERSVANVAIIGDLDGDGQDDLAIGVQDQPFGVSGKAYVVFGGKGRLTALDDSIPTNRDGLIELADLDGANGFRVVDIEAFGAEGGVGNIDIAGAGDINGDGIDDLLIGAVAADANYYDIPGAVRIVFGKDTDTNNDGTADAPFAADLSVRDFDGSNGTSISGAGSEISGLGYSVTGLGDINGDGIDDIAAGAPYRFYSYNSSDPISHQTGSAWVVFGQKAPSDLDATAYHLSNDELTFLGADTVTIESVGTGSVTRIIDDVYLPSARGLTFNGDGVVHALADIVVDGTVASPGGSGGGGGGAATLIFNQDVEICHDATFADSGSGVYFNSDISFSEYDTEDPDHDTADPIGHRTLTLDVTSSTHPSPTIAIGDDAGDLLTLRLAGIDATTIHEQIVINRNLGGGLFVPGALTIDGSLSLVDSAFSLTDGTELTLIENDGTAAIVGNFATIKTAAGSYSGTEGSRITVGANDYLISYAGGDGNDVTLQRVIGNTAPIANAGGPYIVNEGSSITLDASGSSDTEDANAALTFAWDLDNDGQFDDATGIATNFAAVDGPATLTVGLRVTDTEGLSATTSTTINIHNVAPTVVVGSATVTANEGDTATNFGTFDDIGDDMVTIAASIGSITQGDGTWNWSFDTADGPDDSQPVTITATDSDGAQSTVTFDLTVINVAPTVVVGSVSVTADEGSTASNFGTFDDVGDDVVTITASIGSITQAAGTWNWSYETLDGPDDSQTVIITATDSDGAQSTVTFDLTVINVAPAVATLNAFVTANEGSTAINNGTFDDVGDDVVTITASVGSITQGAGTWSWSYDTLDGPDDSQTVTITATDSDGAQSTVTFDLTVINVAPTVVVGSVSVTADEGSTASNFGTFDDVGDDVVTITASVGSITQGAGTWNWSYETLDGPDDSQTVIITATDSDGAQSTVTFDLTVINVAPTVATLNAFVTANEGSTAINNGTFDDVGDDVVTITASVGSITQAAGTWNWSYETLDGPDDSQTVIITATDSDGAQSTVTFDLTVINVAPTVATLNAFVTANEGSTAINNGTFDDVGDDVVTITASIGSITQGAGTWLWSYDTLDGPDDSQTVTITATDSDGAQSTVTFDLTVINVAPTVVVGSVSVTADEDSTASNFGTFDDVGDDVVTITASVGSITQGAGTWSWSYDTLDGPDDSQTVTITATDTDGDASTVTFDLTVFDTGTATLTIDDVTALEGDQGITEFTFTVTLNDVVDTTVTVDLETGFFNSSDVAEIAGDEDFTARSETLTFSPGVMSATFTVQVSGDERIEHNERFVVNLSNVQAGGRDVQIGDGQGIGTILTDDTAVVRIHTLTATVIEGDLALFGIELLNEDESGSAEFGVGVSAHFDLDVSINSLGSTVDVSDIDSAIQALVESRSDLTFGSIIYTAPTEGAVMAPAVLSLSTLDDLLIERTETLTVSVTGLTTADGIQTTGSTAASSVDVAIADNDGPGVWKLTQVNGEDESAAEGSDAVFDLSLQGAFGSHETASVELDISPESLTELGLASGQSTAFVDAVRAAAEIDPDVTVSGTGPLTIQFAAEADGDSMRTLLIRLPIAEDGYIEGPEVLETTLQNPAGSTTIAPVIFGGEGGIQTQTTVLLDADGPGEWSVLGTSDVDEGGLAEFEIQLAGQFGSGETAIVRVTQVDIETDSTDVGDATENSVDLFDQLTILVTGRSDLAFDSVTGTLTFTSQFDGDAMEPLHVVLPIQNDSDVEGAERFQVGLTEAGSPTGSSLQINGAASLALTFINDTQGIGGPPDGDPGTGVTAGFFSGGRILLPGVDGPEENPTATTPLLDAVPVPLPSRSLETSNTAPAATPGGNTIAELEQALLQIVESQDDVPLEEEELFFQIVRPDGALGPKIPLSLEMLDNDDIIATFKKFPNNVYRILYRDAGLESNQTLFELNVRDHQIVPTLIPSADTAVAAPDVENDPIVNDAPPTDPTVSSINHPNPFHPRTAAIQRAAQLLTQPPTAQDADTSLTRTGILMRRHAK